MAKRKKLIDWVLIQRIVENTMGELLDNKPVVAYNMLRRLKEIIAGQQP